MNHTPIQISADLTVKEATLIRYALARMKQSIEDERDSSSDLAYKYLADEDIKCIKGINDKLYQLLIDEVRKRNN